MVYFPSSTLFLAPSVPLFPLFLCMPRKSCLDPAKPLIRGPAPRRSLLHNCIFLFFSPPRQRQTNRQIDGQRILRLGTKNKIKIQLQIFPSPEKIFQQVRCWIYSPSLHISCFIRFSCSTWDEGQTLRIQINVLRWQKLIIKKKKSHRQSVQKQDRYKLTVTKRRKGS